MVRVVRIELTTPAWKVGVLPLNYTRTKMSRKMNFPPLVKRFPLIISCQIKTMFQIITRILIDSCYNYVIINHL